ncbi:MAG: hypothetical protein H0V29_07890 [Thermoleophilaceae bacterium]|nr:hypothetical protein [Thermoleophilaceae bacterium]
MAVLTSLAAVAFPAAAGAEPWSFVKTQTDQLGVPGYVAGGQLTPEGNIYTEIAEMGWNHGRSLRRWNQPLRTLDNGRWPVFSSSDTADGVRYRLEVVATEASGAPYAFARVRMTNTTRAAQTARWGARLSWSEGERKGELRRFRFLRPATPVQAGLYNQPGVPEPRSESHSEKNGVISRADAGPVARVPRASSGPPDRPSWKRRLGPGRSDTLEFSMPLARVAAYAPVGDFETARRRAVGSLQTVVGRSMRVDIPEPAVEDAYYASLVNMLVPRYRTESGQWVQTVNKLQYHAFWLRDAAIMTYAFDLVGLRDIAAENLAFFETWQRPDGLFISRPEQYDGFGQALWAYAEHVRITGDSALAKQVLPRVGRAMSWLEQTRRPDPFGLLPVADLQDNELVRGHLAGDNFWALAGARGAVDIARAAGSEDAAARFQKEADSLQASIAARLSPGLAVEPRLDGEGGQDWGNLWAVYPTGVLEPRDPRVSATLDAVRKDFREGIATYRDRRQLHHYLGFRVFQTELLRGEQKKVTRGLYDSLAHTTASYGGFEAGILVDGSRAVDDNMTPHGWWAAEYVTLIRNMLVREDSQGIALGSAIAPRWLEPGRSTAVSGAPTTRGPVSFRLTATRDGARLKWRGPSGVGIRLVVPAGVSNVKAKGLTADGSSIGLPAPSGTLAIEWKRRGGVYDHDAAVEKLKRSYGVK